MVTLLAVRGVEGLDGEGVDERAARRVLVDAGVVDGEPRGGVPGPEGVGVGVPAAAGVHGLDGEDAELRAGRHVELLGLGAGARRAEGDGVEGALGQARQQLPDRRVVAQAHGVRALRHRQDHAVLLVLPELDVLHESGDLPAG